MIHSEALMPIKIGQPVRQACLSLISDEDSLLFADGYDVASLQVGIGVGWCVSAKPRAAYQTLGF